MSVCVCTWSHNITDTHSPHTHTHTHTFTHPPSNLCPCSSTSGGNWIGELTLPDTRQAPLIFIETWDIDTEIAFDSVCLFPRWTVRSGLFVISVIFLSEFELRDTYLQINPIPHKSLEKPFQFVQINIRYLQDKLGLGPSDEAIMLNLFICAPCVTLSLWISYERFIHSFTLNIQTHFSFRVHSRPWKQLTKQFHLKVDLIAFLELSNITHDLHQQTVFRLLKIVDLNFLNNVTSCAHCQTFVWII